MNCIIIQQKPRKHCKAIFFQLKNNFFKSIGKLQSLWDLAVIKVYKWDYFKEYHKKIWFIIFLCPIIYLLNFFYLIWNSIDTVYYLYIPLVKFQCPVFPHILFKYSFSGYLEIFSNASLYLNYLETLIHLFLSLSIACHFRKRNYISFLVSSY